MNNTHKEKWAKMSYIWGLVQRPGRPSNNDLQNYRELILASGNYNHILVLGSTPEIRDMLIDMKAEGLDIKVTCVDMVEDMYHAMKNLMRNIPNDERFVNGNWLKLSESFNTAEFDIVIGDWVSVNVGIERDTFYSGIKRILKPNGCFIERSGIIPPETPKIEKTAGAVLEIVKNQAKKADSGEISKDQAWNYFISTLMMSAYYLNNQNRIDWGDSYIEEIREVEKQIQLTGSETEKYIFTKFNEVFGPTSGKYWTILKKEEQEEMFKKDFNFIEARVSNDYDEIKCKESPIYLLRNK